VHLEDLVVGGPELVGDVGVERDMLGAAAALVGLALADVVDDHRPHRRRGVRKEVVAILEPQATGALQAQERLVHQRGGVEHQVPVAGREPRAGEAAQLAVELGGQAVQVDRIGGHRGAPEK
jgi:hypothetical protein